VTTPSEFRVAVAGGETTARVYSAGGPAVDAALILGHGAGAGQQSAFMVDFARALAALGLDVVTFNFLYTEQRRRIPDRGPALEECYSAVIAAARERLESARKHLFIGGKSMGGRIATQVAAGDPCAPITGLVLLGYPLHPPGRPDRPRDKHLAAIRRPMLIVQGSRDTFGMPAELTPVLDTLSPRPLMYVVSGGDHSFKISRRNPAEQAAVFDDIQRTIVEWIDGVCQRSQD
jgi:predicted alpha/beta-hydrolase family hydrolase